MTKFEHDAWKGWRNFQTSMNEIWRLYVKYGDVVLEKDLEVDDKELKVLFTQADGNAVEFEKTIRNFWETNFHLVVDNFKDLVSIYKKYTETTEEKSLYLLPETMDFYRDGDMKGSDQTYSVSEEFYKQIYELLNNSKRKCLFLINYEDKEGFEVCFSAYGREVKIFKVENFVEI